MIEYTIAEAPAIFPFTCVWCMGEKGPVLDSHRDLRGYGHVFLCVRCAKKAAKLFGFAPGEKLDELEIAAAVLGERDAEIASLQAEIAKLNESQRVTVKHDSALEQELTAAHEHIAQMEKMLREQAGVALSLIGAGDGAAA